MKCQEDMPLLAEIIEPSIKEAKLFTIREVLAYEGVPFFLIQSSYPCCLSLNALIKIFTWRVHSSCTHRRQKNHQGFPLFSGHNDISNLIRTAFEILHGVGLVKPYEYIVCYNMTFLK